MEEVERIQTTLPSHKSVYDPTGEKEAAALPLDESAGGTGNAAGKPAKDKPPYKITRTVSGYAPGVNDENLKDIINEMEDEYLLRKLGL